MTKSDLLHIVRRRHFEFRRMVVAGLLSTMFGCSGSSVERVPVSGRVLLDGKPLAHGTIIVTPQGVRPAGSEIVDGEFSLMTYEAGDGTALGTHSVAISSKEVLGPARQRWLIPKHYSRATTSGLSLTVDGPTDSALFELSWGKGKPYIENIDSGGR